MSNSSLIKRLYFNPKLSGSYSGLGSFYNHRHLKLPKNVVEKELLKLPEYYLHRPAVKKFRKRRFMVFWPSFMYAFDLVDLQKYKKENRGYA